MRRGDSAQRAEQSEQIDYSFIGVANALTLARARR